MEPFSPVFVIWLDAQTDYGAAKSSDYATWKRYIRRTIGWLIHRDQERIVVAMEDDRLSGVDTDCQTITTIPAAMIMDVVELHQPPSPGRNPPKKKRPRSVA